jgi:hypothetical protein
MRNPFKINLSERQIFKQDFFQCCRADVGETIEATAEVTIVSGYECRARVRVGNGRQNVGAIARERVRDDGDERDRAFGRVIAGLSIPVRTEPGVTTVPLMGRTQQRASGDSSIIAW